LSRKDTEKGLATVCLPVGNIDLATIGRQIILIDHVVIGRGAAKLRHQQHGLGTLKGFYRRAVAVARGCERLKDRLKEAVFLIAPPLNRRGDLI